MIVKVVDRIEGSSEVQNQPQREVQGLAQTNQYGNIPGHTP